MTGPRLTNSQLVKAGVIAGWQLATNGNGGPPPLNAINRVVRRVLTDLGAGAIS